MSSAAHDVVARLDLAGSGVVAARKQARQAVQSYIQQIDVIAQSLLGLPTPPMTEQEMLDDENL